MNKKIQNIVNAVTTSEKSLFIAKKSNFSAYLTIQADYLKLTKIEKKTVLEQILKASATNSKRTIQNRLAMLVTADSKKVDCSKYTSFTQLETALKNLKKGTHRVLKSGANKGTAKSDTKMVAKVNDKATEILKAKNDGIAEILADAKFIEFMKYAKSEKINLNYLRLAIK